MWRSKPGPVRRSGLWAPKAAKADGNQLAALVWRRRKNRRWLRARSTQLQPNFQPQLSLAGPSIPCQPQVAGPSARLEARPPTRSLPCQQQGLAPLQQRQIPAGGFQQPQPGRGSSNSRLAATVNSGREDPLLAPAHPGRAGRRPPWPPGKETSFGLIHFRGPHCADQQRHGKLAERSSCLDQAGGSLRTLACSQGSYSRSPRGQPGQPGTSRSRAGAVAWCPAPCSAEKPVGPTVEQQAHIAAIVTIQRARNSPPRRNGLAPSSNKNSRPMWIGAEG